MSHWLFLLGLLCFFGCGEPTVEIIDTDIPERSLIISPFCVGLIDKESRELVIMKCRKYDLTALRYIEDEFDYELKEGELWVMIPTSEWDRFIEHGVRHGWLKRDE